MERLTKIRFPSRDVTEIEITETNEKGEDTTIKKEISSREIRHQDFQVAGEALAAPVLKLAGFPKSFEDDTEFRSVRFKRDDKHGLCMNICLVRILKAFGESKISGSIVLNFPLIHEDLAEIGNNKMPKHLYDKVMTLFNEADAFLRQGKRAQGELNLEQKDQEVANEEEQDEAA